MISTTKIISLLLLAFGLVTTAEAARPYTVDDMLALESIGKARFDPEGDVLVFERYGLFEGQSDFGRQFVIGELRSKIYRVDLSGTDAPRRLFDQQEGDGYTFGGISPDGAYLTYLHVSDQGLDAGVAAPSGGQTGRFRPEERRVGTECVSTGRSR